MTRSYNSFGIVFRDSPRERFNGLVYSLNEGKESARNFLDGEELVGYIPIEVRVNCEGTMNVLEKEFGVKSSRIFLPHAIPFNATFEQIEDMMLRIANTDDITYLPMFQKHLEIFTRYQENNLTNWNS